MHLTAWPDEAKDVCRQSHINVCVTEYQAAHKDMDVGCPMHVTMALILCHAFLLLSMSMAASPSSSPNRNNEADRLALLSFRSLVSDPSGALLSWGGNTSSSLDHCHWKGVACGKHGRVVALDLASLGLAGPISPSIANLTFLRLLHLSDNGFYGPIPPQIGQLRRLQQLNLSLNSLDGEIPAPLSNCSKLLSLSLFNNNLGGGMPRGVGSLSSLEMIDISNNNLTGGIPPEIGQLVSLNFLDLSYNLFSGAIPEFIGKLQELQRLGLNQNELSGAIPPSLGNLSSLVGLYIENNSLSGPIPSSLGDLSSLQILTLAGNNLQGTIPPSLGNLSSLDLMLNVGFNNLHGPIPSSLQSLRSLTTLELLENKLVGRLPPWLIEMPSLTFLTVGINNLTGEIPLSPRNQSGLQYLDVQWNKMVGSLPANLGHSFPQLQFLGMNNNQFHGPIPASLSNSSMLQFIQLDSNSFSGTIPPSIGNLQSLTELVIDSNQIEARNDADWSFMDALSNCTVLQVVQLDTNRLGGTLPSSVANLSASLQRLGLSLNQIRGSIPEGIGNLAGLGYFDLHSNLLTGALPTTLGRLQMLQELDLSSNQLWGEVPSTIGNLTQMSRLALANNTLTGLIPSSLGRCPLELLTLNNNKLSGVVPREVFLVSSLTDLFDLSGNLLSGPLPLEVGSLKNLVTINLSANKFSGEIPSQFGNCEVLEVLLLASNSFTGSIPSSLSNIKGLQALDLSQNNLSGLISEFLASFSDLQYLNLSFNNFKGPVPTSSIFRNASAVSLAGNSGLCGGVPALKLPPCSGHQTSSKKHPPPKLIIVIIVIVCAAATVFLLYIVANGARRLEHIKAPSAAETKRNDQFIRVSYDALARATGAFSPANLLGVGGFGSVYKGVMELDGLNEVVIAVKVLNLQQQGASKSFAVECEALRNIRHRNLVKILTACSSIDSGGNDFKALVFEFFPNGSLDQWLHPQITEEEEGTPKMLSLIQRLNIAIDVASALEYLHCSGPAPIVHCDLKPSNILLDDGMVGHVGDFGLARLLDQAMAMPSHMSTSSAFLKGTIGYAAPEYGTGHRVSTHGDIYSYGILLLEMFTRKRPTDDSFKDGLDLHQYVGMALPEKVIEIMDPRLVLEEEVEEEINGKELQCVVSVLKLGVLCSKKPPTERMQIRDIMKELNGIRKKFLY